jgi:hypothetical protein
MVQSQKVPRHILQRHQKLGSRVFLALCADYRLHLEVSYPEPAKYRTMDCVSGEF